MTGQLELAQWLAMAPDAFEPVVFGRNNFILPIYIEPLHTRPAWGMRSSNINNADHSLLTADHPRREQMNPALLLLDDPGILAEVHQLQLLDQENQLASIIKLHHCLETPLEPQHHIIEQQEQDTHLMKEWVA